MNNLFNNGRQYQFKTHVLDLTRPIRNAEFCCIYVILAKFKILFGRAVRYDDIYRMDEIKSLSFHIMVYRLFRGVTKYIAYGNTFS